MKSTRLPGVFYSAVYQPDRRIDFNGFLWVREGGNVLIDPMPLDDEQLAFVREAGGADWILVTNADHLRAAPELAESLGAKIAAAEAERPRFGEHEGRIAHWFTDRESLPAGLGADVDVRWLRGGKSAAEPAFVLEPLGALVCGDLLRSHESGRLRLLPDPKLSDAAQAAADVRALGTDFDAVLLGDGDCLFTGARAALTELADALA